MRTTTGRANILWFLSVLKIECIISCNLYNSIRQILLLFLFYSEETKSRKIKLACHIANNERVSVQSSQLLPKSAHILTLLYCHHDLTPSLDLKLLYNSFKYILKMKKLVTQSMGSLSLLGNTKED